MDSNGTEDPRFIRTREIVMKAARRIIFEEGQSAVTTSRITEETGIARSTLYRHWRDRDGIIFEAIADDTERPPFAPTGDTRNDLTRYLRLLRDGLAAPHTPLLAARIDRAEHDPEVENVLRTSAANRRDMIRDLLEHPDEDFSAVQALIVGPLMYQRFLAHVEITDELIDLVVDSYMQIRPDLQE